MLLNWTNNYNKLIGPAHGQNFPEKEFSLELRKNCYKQMSTFFTWTFLREVKFFCVFVLLLRGRRSKFLRAQFFFLLPNDIVVHNPNMFLINILCCWLFSQHWITATWLIVDSKGNPPPPPKKTCLLLLTTQCIFDVHC